MSLVTLDGLTKRFPVQRTWRELARDPFAATEVLVVDQVSFEVRAGEIFGLLGQNGAGKTTIFKMLATLLLADEGRARIAGHDVATDGAAVRRLIAPVLANERSLYWRLDARENLRLYAALQGVAAHTTAAEVERVLARTALAGTGAQLVGTFSSGMRQRLLIARALLGRPRILLLDEPTRSLDPISARDFRSFLRDDVVNGEGCTVLLATHNAEEVWDLCDRVAVLERGRLLAVDATTTLRHRAGGDRCRVWVRSAEAERALAAGAAAGFRLEQRGAAPEDGWEELLGAIGGGAEGAARVLAAIGAEGRAVARFERDQPTLADLIARVLATAPGVQHA